MIELTASAIFRELLHVLENNGLVLASLLALRVRSCLSSNYDLDLPKSNPTLLTYLEFF